MKATDLRIGNWIIHEDTFGMVYNETTKQITNGSELDDLQLSQSKPIPLTEEWLVKFGFEKSWSCMDYDRYQKEGFNMLKDYGEQCIKLPRDGGGYIHLNCGYYDNEIDFDYVHQLQNLYHALTGKELTIK